ncbi:sortase [Candidatus Saccharibacteria bacterium]|nr:sortase [Candidatus Saccharibacteria bacterium]
MRGKPLVLLLPLVGLLAATLACSRADVPAPPPPTPTAQESQERETVVIPTEELAPLDVVPTPLPALEPTPTPTPVYLTEEDLVNGDVRLEIPAIGLDEPLRVAEVVTTTSGSMSWIRKSNDPIWIPTWTSYIGAEGVALVWGERQWGPVPMVFTSLDKLEVGDDIIVRSTIEVLHFRVIGSVVVNPDEVWLTFQTYDREAREVRSSQLALLTCTPWGTSRQRLVVFAERVNSPEEEYEELTAYPHP